MTTPNVPGNYYQPWRPYVPGPSIKVAVVFLVVCAFTSVLVVGLFIRLFNPGYYRWPGTLDISGTTDGRFVVVGTRSEESDLVTVHDLDTGKLYSCHVGMTSGAYPIFDAVRRAIVFSCRDAIWSTPLAGGPARRLTPAAGLAGSVALSCDGTTLYYTRAVSIHPLKGGCGGWTDYDLFAINLNGGSERQLTHRALRYMMDLSTSREGRYVYASTETNYESVRISRVDLQTGTLITITPDGDYYFNPVLYAGGTRLLVYVDQTRPDGHDGTIQDIYSMLDDGTDMRRLSRGLDYPSCVVVLESRKLILFVQHRAQTDKQEIWQMPFDGGTAGPETVLDSLTSSSRT